MMDDQPLWAELLHLQNNQVQLETVSLEYLFLKCDNVSNTIF